MTLEIVRATGSDADSVTSVYLRSRTGAGEAIPPGVHPMHEVHEHVSYELIPNRETWLASDDGEPVAVLVLHDDDLHWLWVVPEAQGRGVGSALLDHAKAERPGGLALWVFTSNTPARGFYERRGFTAVRETDGDNEEGAPDVRLVWGEPKDAK